MTKTLVCAVSFTSIIIIFLFFYHVQTHFIFFLNSKKHRFIDGFDFRFESWLCHLVVVAVFGWLETLVSAERGRLEKYNVCEATNEFSTI